MTVAPINEEIARAVLLIGQFVQVFDGNEYARMIPEEGTRVTATIQNDALHLQISPPISMMSHHSDKRITASVYFEVAAKYAEKTNGTITQMSNIGACIEDGVSMKVLARYPDEPMDFTKICKGFIEVLSGGHIHEDFENEPIAFG